MAIHRSVGGWGEESRPPWCNFPNYTEARARWRGVVEAGGGGFDASSADPCTGGSSSALGNVSLRALARGVEGSAGRAATVLTGRRGFGSASCSGSYTPMVISPRPYWSNDDAKNTVNGCGPACVEKFGTGKAEWWNVWWSSSGTSYCRCYICCSDPQAGTNPSCVCQKDYYGNGRSCSSCPSGSSTSTYGQSACRCSSSTEAWTGSSCDTCCSEGACTDVTSCASAGVSFSCFQSFLPPCPPGICGYTTLCISSDANHAWANETNGRIERSPPPGHGQAKVACGCGLGCFGGAWAEGSN